MLKHLLIFFVLMACTHQSKAQTAANNSDRQEFIANMNNFAKKQHLVQQIPEFKGGPGALYDYLQAHIVYPPQAKKDGLSALVFVSFRIDAKTGLARDVKIVQSSNSKFESETTRLIKAMPAWTPAQQGGKSVDMILTIPVYFHLD